MAKAPTAIPAEAFKPSAPDSPPVTFTMPPDPNLQERKRLFELFATMYPMTQVLDIPLINRRVAQIMAEYEKWK